MEQAQRTEENQYQLGGYQLTRMIGLEKIIMNKQRIKEGLLFPEETLNTENTTMPIQKIDKRRKPAIFEPRPTLTKEEMRNKIANLKEIETPMGIRYIKLHLTAKMLIGIRESSGKEFTINLDDLFKAYQNCLRFTSPEVKKYIFMGHSPATSILRMLQKGL